MTEYTPTVWHDGDAITAEKLNKIENRLQEIYEEYFENRVIQIQNSNSEPVVQEEY